MNPMHRQPHSGQSTTEYGIAIALIAVIAIAALASASVAVGGAFGFINQRVEAVIPTSGSGSAPTAFVTPAIQTVGQTVTVSGTGYTPDSSVTITLHSTPTVLGTTPADSAGRVTYTTVVPLGTVPEQHAVLLSDTSHSAQAPLQVNLAPSTTTTFGAALAPAPLAFNAADVPADLDPAVPFIFTAASFPTLAPVPQHGQFAWINICAAAPCTASAPAIASMIQAEPTSENTVGTGIQIAPLQAGMWTSLFSDLAALDGTTFPVAIVNNAGTLVGWTDFRLDAATGGTSKTITGAFVAQP